MTTVPGVTRPTGLEGTTMLTSFARRVAERHQIDVSDYRLLHAWSVAQPAEFWTEVWDFFGVVSSRRFDTVLDAPQMPGARWFSGARLNYTDQVLRHVGTQRSPAIVVISEEGARREVSWQQLADQVTAFAATLRAAGVVTGDRVVGYLPNADEAIVAFLGAAAVGAVWAGCAPDYGAAAASDRLAQLEPVVLVGAAAYSFNGVLRDRRDVLIELAGRLAPRVVISVSRGGVDVDHQDLSGDTRWMTWDDAVTRVDDQVLRTEQLPPDHPLWVLFSSGTTGIPKGIVHGHAGVIVTHQVLLGLHQDLSSDGTLFWFTTTNWMLWNVVVSALLLGATTIVYEGSPTFPTADRLWEVAAQERATQLGTSPGLMQAAATTGLRPGDDHDLSHLTIVMATGAPVPESLFHWFDEAVSPDIPLVSTSGGTDVVSSFVGGRPGEASRPGEILGPLLGVAVQAFDETGQPVRDAVGELVVTVPMPSMPIKFWNDPDGSRYHAAYFDTFPGVWRHGDWVTHTAHDSFIVHGRSDSTLNRNGVRVGSADLYGVVEGVSGVAEALVLGVERADGSYRMPMFLVPTKGAVLDDEAIDLIRQRLRTDISPRHVPDEFHVVEAVPHTKTGKKLEVPLKRILQGAAADEVLSAGAVDRPELISYYVDLRRRWDEQDAHAR